MFRLLAKAKIEDVFRSTGEQLNAAPGSRTMTALLLLALGIVLVLVLINNRLKRLTTPRVLNHHGRLIREVRRKVALRSADLKRLKAIAAERDLCSPLVLMLCPSLLARAMEEQRTKP